VYLLPYPQGKLPAIEGFFPTHPLLAAQDCQTNFLSYKLIKGLDEVFNVYLKGIKMGLRTVS
jgi:hypothetical protein